jgi:hypothetical protein
MSLRTSKGTALVILGCIAALVSWRAAHRTHAKALAAPAATMQQEPLVMLWAWEVPEDLTALDATKTGVAFLSREILLNQSLHVRPRMQPLHLAPNTWLMAVVRIETAPDFQPSTKLTIATAQAIADVSQQSNVHAIQVDFDATASQRDFYAAILRQLRNDLPPQTPLSITALVSWCGDHSWLSTIGPSVIDEAVPMFFRMGGPATTRATTPRNTSIITEPLCSTSVGIATDEVFPAIHSGQRVYVFCPGAWTAEDLAHINAFGYQSLRHLSGP